MAKPRPHKEYIMNPNSLKNLKPFQKGNRANPAGRPPKDISLTSLLKEEIETVPNLVSKDGQKNTLTWRQLLVRSWLANAIKNPVMFNILIDRLEGKVTQNFRIIEVRDEAEKLARELGLPVADVLAEAEKLASSEWVKRVG